MVAGGAARSKHTRPGYPVGLLLALALLQAGVAPLKADQDAAPPDARAGPMVAEADALSWRYELSASRRALELYAQALDTLDEEGDHALAARTLQRMGTVQAQTGALEEALSCFEEGLRRGRAAGDRQLESRLLADLGQTLVLLGKPAAGQERCVEAQSLAREAGSLNAEAKALDCLGEVEYHRGDLLAALGIHRRAEALWSQLGDERGRAGALLNLGSVHSDLSELGAAGESFERALILWRQLGDRRGEALALVALARLHDRTGQYQAALHAAREAMPLIEPMGDLTWQASVHFAIGSVYEHLGEGATAARYWSEALELFRRAGLRIAEADVLMWLGRLELASGDGAAALALLDEALALSRQIDNPGLTADTLSFIGLAHAAEGRTDLALADYGEALVLLRADEDRRAEALVLNGIARAHELRGELALAVEHARRSIALSREARDPLAESDGLYSLARLADSQGDLPVARQNIEASLELAESLRLGIASQELRGSYLASIQPRYELLIDLLMRQHRQRPEEGFAAQALRVSERARARSLVESLSEAGIDLRRGAAREVLERERLLKLEIDGKAERLMRLSSIEPGALSTMALDSEIRALSDEYDQLQSEIRSQSPRYLTLTQPDSLTLAAIQQQILDGETLLLEYALGDERSYLWAVTADRLESYELPPRAELEGAARELYALLTARLPVAGESFTEQRKRVRAADDQYWTAGAALARALLGPVADKLVGQRLLVVGDGALRYLPFGALPAPGSSPPVPLAAEHEIVNLPSASTLAVLRRETAGRVPAALSVAVLADPVFEADDPRIPGAAGLRDQSSAAAEGQAPGLTRALRQLGLAEGERLSIPRLVATRREAAAIVAAAPAGSSLSALGFEASRETALSPRLSGYKIVHFATHGIVDGENPGLSGIVLSMIDAQGRPQNGLLRLHDIYNLELPAELVVLSACNSALGKEVRGEGLVGLVRGFMYAGARRVVASLWKVDDEATGELMGRFYRHMLTGGRSPAAALRQAQIEMWEQPQWRAPFYWGAFVLQGEWQ